MEGASIGQTHVSLSTSHLKWLFEDMSGQMMDMMRGAGDKRVTTSFMPFSDRTSNMYPVHNWSGNAPATPGSFVVPSLVYILDTVVQVLLVLWYSTKISIAHKEHLATSPKW